MRPDFSLIWGADNAPFTAIEASDYTAGWVFRTGAPPRRVNFDYFQNLSDQRTAWLGEQMLLAVGHEWQDDVSYDAYAIVRSPVNGQLYRSLVGSNLNNEPSVSGSQWALGVEESADTLNASIASIAVAGTVNLTSGAPDTSNIVFTGSGTINNVTVAAGRVFFARFNGSVTLTNSASLVTNSGANIVTAAGDSCVIRATAANTVEVICGNFLAFKSIGVGQAWQNVTGSRTQGVNYTNTTGRPILVSVFGENNSGAKSLIVDGLSVARFTPIATGTISTTCSAIVPPGSVYSVTNILTTVSWMELR